MIAGLGEVTSIYDDFIDSDGPQSSQPFADMVDWPDDCQFVDQIARYRGFGGFEVRDPSHIGECTAFGEHIVYAHRPAHLIEDLWHIESGRFDQPAHARKRI